MIQTIHIHDRNCSSWDIVNNENLVCSSLDVNPYAAKLFDKDVFCFSDDAASIKLIHSVVRQTQSIPGVLLLNGNKTFGKPNAKSSKRLYQCVPDDSHLPVFLIPYEIKQTQFSKVLQNVYVTFVFDQWTEKHPHAKLDNVIGGVDVLDNFYEYQLCCKGLNVSMQPFQKQTHKLLSNKDNLIDIMQSQYSSFEDRTDQTKWFVFTIDSSSTTDYDDGFSIQSTFANVDHQVLSIYISNVVVWMDLFQLWESFSERVSTIYLPNKKRSMLPTILSEKFCSLQQNEIRVAFAMDIHLTQANVTNISFHTCFIKVSKNFSYEENALVRNRHYKQVAHISRQLSNQFTFLPEICNSHDVVSSLMIFMNVQTSEVLLKHKTGIFRCSKPTQNHILSEDVLQFMKTQDLNLTVGQYENGAECMNTRHDALQVDSYVHITSPIRRLVDLLNMLKMHEILGLFELSSQAHQFYDKWISNMDYVNTTMRSIRKVQCECSLLDLCVNNAEVMEKEYTGYLMEKTIWKDELWQYLVYLPALKLSSRVVSRENLDCFTQRTFSLHFFVNEEKFKKKIRLQLC
jgi:exoribonuclease R